MNPERSARGLHLGTALAGLTVTFRGMTARPDETNCECHWGDAEELALLKVPDVELDSDLLHRTWAAGDWRDHASVLRRILPQLATALVSGRVEPWIDQVGRSFARGAWQYWPAEQTQAVQDFLEAWWTHTLTEPQPTVPAHEVFAFCAIASDDLSVWLNIWQAAAHPAADQHLADAVAHWADDLMDDELPWDPTPASHEREQRVRADLAAWLARNAPTRLRNHGCLPNCCTKYDSSASAPPPAGMTRTGQPAAAENCETPESCLLRQNARTSICPRAEVPPRPSRSVTSTSRQNNAPAFGASSHQGKAFDATGQLAIEGQKTCSASPIRPNFRHVLGVRKIFPM